MNITTLLPLILLVGVMFLMTRSAKKRQQQAAEMRNAMEPGSGVRTIGGMYALVKSINEDTVELEVAPGVHTHFAKNAIAAVLDPTEYAAIVHGTPAADDALPAFDEDDAAKQDVPVELEKDTPKTLNLDKPAADAAPAKAEDTSKDAEDEGPAAK